MSPRFSNEHALDRAYERYFVCLDDEDLEDIIEIIQDGRARWSAMDWPTNSIWLVDYEGMTMKVVYNGREKRICTFLPYETER
jgi:hypothetical protein